MSSLHILELGRRPYREVLLLQRDLHARVARGEEPDTWIVVEHEPVITLGRKARSENVLVPMQLLSLRGIDLVEIERGGDVTYHGPGQVVVYPIVKLPRFREVEPFVSALEASVIDALATFGIAAVRRAEHRGVYVGHRAICAIGLAVKQMTTMHGLALNVCTRLDYDRLITPCGTPAFGITSISRELSDNVSWEGGRDALLAALERRFKPESRALVA
ncbi:MAG: lipoyl(octanoyl) transferase LipB [Candidatus Eremiobacteraeota bacterium]|nr:lipoyl(octanoyl) transferase LipB [Candidatus Eremiobacteraeota bacterium]MBC5802483.1 lipoyl(octanoyl) transferase LipB [Candidatus Eremiobacteraeota bacterium]MBC5822552.1 lipoyl(octanoyl) transferase LipB [Candidatus Eremiobacteraeota bacterium]